MKRILIVLTALLALVPGLLAQRTIDSKVSIGLRGGLTLSSMQFSPSVKQQMAQGVLAGIAVRYSEEKTFGLLAELELAQRGWREDFEAHNEKFDYNRTLTYIQLPVMTHISFGTKRFKGFVNLGPSVSYMIGDKIDANFDYSDVQHVTGFPAGYRQTAQLYLPVKNKVDYGITGGAGIEFYVTPRNSLMLDGRYYFGLGSIFPTRKSDAFTASRGTSIEVALTYMFHLK